MQISIERSQEMMNLEQIKELAHQAGLQNGCRIYDLYRHRDRLQFLIDKPATKISLQDCENVFHSLKFLMHSHCPEILDQKILEVSSPGVTKRLREIWHFKEVLNQEIKVSTHIPIITFDLKKQKDIRCQTIIGKLISVLPDGIQLQQRDREWKILFDQIKTAHLVFENLHKSNKRGIK